MDEVEARKLLGENVVQNNNDLSDLGWRLEYVFEDDYATLDGCFEAEELEAIAWWMKNKERKGEDQQS